ncbi:hypothetical protein CDV52_09005 [Haematobacter missouriensis]|uniref:Uncharacterized protein n=1 Tax=Haematobacter missouriensis TaxID=366616 RepID=A0A212AR96_9RHOB|nr:hypothetical protein CDV52_09005 [Haematobacter missouriensis]
MTVECYHILKVVFLAAEMGGTRSLPTVFGLLAAFISNPNLPRPCGKWQRRSTLRKYADVRAGMAAQGARGARDAASPV